MRKLAVKSFVIFAIASSTLCQGQTEPSLPDAPRPADSRNASTPQAYRPETENERFHSYVKSLFSYKTILEAGLRSGMQQARGYPEEWPQGAEGYGQRYGSALGQIAIRSTAQYVIADIFHEDLRFLPCGKSCPESKFVVAMKDTVMARKGMDGHRSFSVARVSAPLISGAVVSNTWYPEGRGGKEMFIQAGMSYGFGFVRNLFREVLAH